jgi:hypothetical protein
LSHPHDPRDPWLILLCGSYFSAGHFSALLRSMFRHIRVDSHHCYLGQQHFLGMRFHAFSQAGQGEWSLANNDRIILSTEPLKAGQLLSKVVWIYGIKPGRLVANGRFGFV